MNTIEQLKARANPADAIQWLIDAHPGLIRKPDEDEPIKWIDSLISSASRYHSVPEFLRYVDWLIERSKTPAQDGVQLLTIHKAKGLEYDTVFVAGLAEGLLPHKKAVSGEALREETRLPMSPSHEQGIICSC